MTFTQRIELANDYNEYISENDIKDCPFSVITFLCIKGLIQEVSYDELIRNSLVLHLKHRLYEAALNNIRVKCDADIVYAEIAERRLDTWIDEYLEGDSYD